ncbi:MAG: isochorismatase family protein [Nannocystis sp.]|nr:isochorismatase family protein [Nannocystis sp.]MBA3545070.1 isochorismatase family protein [Nannocystis sp.]
MSNTRNIPDRLNIDDAVVAFVDHQSGLASLARSAMPELLRNNVLALADAAMLFRLPVVLSTSFEQGPNGPLHPELGRRIRGAAYVPRPGEVNAFDNRDFVQALRQTGRRQLVISGLTTDVCVTLATLSALREGYQVFVVSDASAALTHEAHGVALMRMAVAGAQLVTWFSVVGEMMQDWRRDPQGLAQLIAEHVVPYRDLIVSFEGKQQRQ